MDLPKVIINDNYTDFLNGEEVEATVVTTNMALEQGMHVMGFHDSIAVNTTVSVPREKQAQYIGVEGLVTAVGDRADKAGQAQHVKIKKV